MDTIPIFLFFFFALIYTIYYFSVAIFKVEYKKFFVIFDNKIETIYYCIDHIDRINDSITYYLKDTDPNDCEFYVVVYVRKLRGSFYKLNYFTHFGISRAREGSFLAKIIKMKPEEGRKAIMNLVTQIKESETCPYKIK